MKIVTNRCYGGFGLSVAGKKLYAHKSGFELFFYERDRESNEYHKVENPSDNMGLLFTFKKDQGGTITSKTMNSSSDYWSPRDIERDDPILVQVVEELGTSASGPHSNLGITEIPDGTSWEIEEYDGNEHVAETHQTW